MYQLVLYSEYSLYWTLVNGRSTYSMFIFPRSHPVLYQIMLMLKRFGTSSFCLQLHNKHCLALQGHLLLIGSRDSTSIAMTKAKDSGRYVDNCPLEKLYSMLCCTTGSGEIIFAGGWTGGSKRFSRRSYTILVV